MDILLQAVALLYLTLITYVFLKQKKLNKIENFVYKGMIALNYVEIAFDIGYHIANYYIPDSIWTMILTKLFICSSISWAFGFASYVYVISSPKNTGEEATDELKKFFINKFMIVLGFIAVADILVFILPLGIETYKGSIILSGWALSFMYGAIGATTIVNTYTMLKNRQNIRDKKFMVVWLLSGLLLIGFIIFLVTGFIKNIYFRKNNTFFKICGKIKINY